MTFCLRRKNAWLVRQHPDKPLTHDVSASKTVVQPLGSSNQVTDGPQPSVLSQSVTTNRASACPGSAPNMETEMLSSRVSYTGVSLHASARLGGAQ